MAHFSIQYLEDSPDIPHLAPEDVRARLREACARLPITYLLLGWHLPQRLIDVCADECDRAGVALYRWHPLLTGDGALMPQPDWQTIGLDDRPIAGFQNMPEFTFICPNRPAVREAVHAHLSELLAARYFSGVFLDRMRWPSPAGDPERALGCFCPACVAAARDQGLDLAAAQQLIRTLFTTAEGVRAFVRALLGPDEGPTGVAAVDALRAVLRFRTESIARFLAEVMALIRAQGCAVGLDSFSPALTLAVGQDLGALDRGADWTKIMSYGHTLGPAGLPFELLGLADWLIDRHGVAEASALALLSEATGLALPATRADLRRTGLAPRALHDEARRARQAGVRTLLAGIELVELPGVAELNPAQISADLQAFRQAGVDGLALSWDLWLMPLDRLDLVRAVWDV